MLLTIVKTVALFGAAAAANAGRRFAATLAGYLIAGGLLAASLCFLTLAGYRALSQALGDVYASLIVGCLYFVAGLATLPIEPYESALIDGASSAQMFWRITLPLLRPTIIVALLFRAIDCLKTFDIIYVMTQGGPGFASETLNVYTFQVGLFYFHIGYASSLLVILFALVLGVSLLLIKVRRAAW